MTNHPLNYAPQTTLNYILNTMTDFSVSYLYVVFDRQFQAKIYLFGAPKGAVLISEKEVINALSNSKLNELKSSQQC